jgi:hypothetical protein
MASRLTMIYQPVLGSGGLQADGRRSDLRWSVATWYATVRIGHSFYTDLIDVSVGDD